MPVGRFYLEQLPQPSSAVFITGEELHHLRQVVRCRPGDTVELVDGKGGLAEAELCSSSPKKAELITTAVYVHTPAPPPLVLLQGVCRPAALEWISEKGTELGMSNLLLFHGERSKTQHTNTERLQRLSIAAMKQSGNLFLPEIALYDSLDATLEALAPLGTLTLCFGSLLHQAATLPPLENSERGRAVCIGPEGGFSPTEEELLLARGARPTRLHHHTLRAETAAIIALAYASHGWL